MRLIGAFHTQEEAEHFSSFLKQKGIESHSDVAFDPKDGHLSYQIWVRDEDRIVEATTLFGQFEEKSEVRTRNAEVRNQKEIPFRRTRAPLTTFVIALCALIFLLNLLQMIPLKEKGLPEAAFLFTPIQALFLFDFPPPFEQIEQEIQQNSPQLKADLEHLDSAPFWRGLYAWTLLKLKGQDTSLAEGPLFYKIGQGEFWRFFTPCLLHGSFLHILFNMIWVWILGRPIELRIGPLKTLLLSLATGIGPNLAQYLMSGPLFLGYSGIVLGLAGFIWMRERIAPWEGYPLNRSTILFLLFFISAMFALQFASFLMQVFTNIPFEPNIANTAHIIGALIGAALARLPYFAWRTK